MKNDYILFIEDDRSGREMGIFNLKKAGFDVDGASNGEEGLALFDPHRHALVITDVKMPGISGLDVLRAVRSITKPLPVNVRVIAATNRNLEQEVKTGVIERVLELKKRQYYPSRQVPRHSSTCSRLQDGEI